MNPTKLIRLSAVTLATGWLYAQAPTEPLIESVAPATEQRQPDAPPSVPSAPADPAAAASPEKPAVAIPFGPLEAQKQDMQKSEEGFIIKDAGLNDIFQFLAKAAGRQYFHNAKIAGTEFLVTGHLNEGNPLAQMEELAFMYGLTLHTKGNTIYALTQTQLNQLPSAEFHYQLRYLRPLDIEKIKELIKPMLSPGTGIVNFEPKTNTIIIIDSAHRIEQARALLHGIDKANGQIIVETKILSINSGTAERTGIDWSTSLGKTGTPVNITRDLNSIFGLPSQLPAAAGVGQSNLVLSPIDLSGVLHALAEGNLISLISNPTLITEDNEQATISIINRQPIITQTISGIGQAAVATEQVRYKIDLGDKSIDTDPDKHREIGISMVVTPTLLPDGTVRMKLRPRSAQITSYVPSGLPDNDSQYPQVTESMLECIARVPDGYSLVVGGFYGETTSKGKNKIPVLGDIPVINFFFKSKGDTKTKNSLVFIVTPKSYNPANRAANRSAGNRVRASTTLECDHDWIDDENPGPAHEPNLKRAIRGLQPTQAPYYPRATEVMEGPAPARPPSRSGSGGR